MKVHFSEQACMTVTLPRMTFEEQSMPVHACQYKAYLNVCVFVSECVNVSKCVCEQKYVTMKHQNVF